VASAKAEADVQVASAKADADVRVASAKADADAREISANAEANAPSADQPIARRAVSEMFHHPPTSESRQRQYPMKAFQMAITMAQGAG